MLAFLKPKQGVMVRDPETMLHLKPEGEYKELSRYWRGVVRDGDAEIVNSLPASDLNTSEEIDQ